LDFLPEVVVAGDDRILLCQVLTFLSEWTQQTTKTGAHSNKMAWEQDHNHCGIHHPQWPLHTQDNESTYIPSHHHWEVRAL